MKMRHSDNVALLAAALLLRAPGTAHAFGTNAAPRSRKAGAARAPHHQTPLAPLASTTDTEAAAATALAASSASSASSPAPLAPDFQAARDSVAAVIASSVPDPALEAPLVYFVEEYFRALAAAGAAGATNPDGSAVTAGQALDNMRTTLDFGMRHGLGVGNPEGKFVFEEVRQRALRGEAWDGAGDGDAGLRARLGADAATDFYAAGCDFFRPAIDLPRSLVLGRDHLAAALAQLAAGENVVFLANHQSEADPQAVSCLLETVDADAGDLAARVTYVAGHKVTTDPLAVPFSMGRNLLCIHSKKHIDADPATKPAKSRQNMAAMSAMLAGFKEGGMAVWVAPSGGRDRRDVATGKIPIAPFDQKTVDMFRLMGNKSRTPTHFYPLSMVTYDLCPPPDTVEAGVGERRNVRFTPCGIKVGAEVPNVGGAEKRHLFTERAEEDCAAGYVELLEGLGMEQYVP